MIIADFTLEDTLGILQVRGVLEGLAARLAATIITPEQIAHLKSVHAMVEKLDQDSAESGEEFMLADRTFHDYIIQVSGNFHISRINDSLKGRLMRLHTLLIDLSEGRILDQVRQEHSEILEAIANRQPERAEHLCRLHMGLMGEHVEAMVASRRDRGGDERSKGRILSWNSLTDLDS